MLNNKPKILSPKKLQIKAHKLIQALKSISNNNKDNKDLN